MTAVDPGSATGSGASSSRRRRLDPDTLADLEEQRHFLLRSLDDLEREREAAEIDDADYQELKDDYTRRAAEVIRAIDEGKAAFAVARRTKVGWPRRLAVCAAVTAFAVGAGFAVAASSGERLQGDTVTGQIRETASMKIQRATRLVQEGRHTDALIILDEVVEDDPRNVEALTERGLLLISLGAGADRPSLTANGRESIERALEIDPDHPRALFYLGLANLSEGDEEAAVEAFQQALDADPPAALRAQIDRVLQAGQDGSTEGEAEAEADAGTDGDGASADG